MAHHPTPHPPCTPNPRPTHSIPLPHPLLPGSGVQSWKWKVDIEVVRRGQVLPVRTVQKNKGHSRGALGLGPYTQTPWLRGDANQKWRGHWEAGRPDQGMGEAHSPS